LESQTPRKTASQDSLDMIDARLSPRNNPPVTNEKTPEKVTYNILILSPSKSRVFSGLLPGLITPIWLIYEFSTCNGRVYCFSMQVVTNKCFLLNLEKNLVQICLVVLEKNQSWGEHCWCKLSLKFFQVKLLYRSAEFLDEWSFHCLSCLKARGLRIISIEYNIFRCEISHIDKSSQIDRSRFTEIPANLFKACL